MDRGGNQPDASTQREMVYVTSLRYLAAGLGFNH